MAQLITPYLDFSQANLSIRGVPIFEIGDDLIESMDDQAGPTVSKKYLCLWQDRYRLADSLCGFATVAGGRGGTITFTPPFAYPESPNIFARRVSLKGVGKTVAGPKGIGRQYAVATVDFATLPWPTGLEQTQDSGPMSFDDSSSQMVYATSEIGVGSEPFMRPASSLKYQPEGSGQSFQMTQGFSVDVWHATLSITFNMLPFMPINALPFVNSVNDTDGFLGCAKGTCRFRGAPTSRSYATNGVSQSTTLLFEYRPSKDWNYFTNPNPQAGAALWARIFNAADNSPIFPYKDLSQVFPSQAYAA